MRQKKAISIIVSLVLPVALMAGYACSPSKPEPVKTYTIPDDNYNPADWGKAYPLEYDSWLKNQGPNALTSRYKRGDDTEKMNFDKLSEYPYLALLFNGWGFGVEYNEPHGHYYMLSDQLVIDPSRLKAGGACLTCKTPFAPKLQQEMGLDYYKLPYLDVHAKIPKEFQKMGAACITCHNNQTMDLKILQPPLKKALADIGKDPQKLTRQEMRSLVCAQCHVTYIIPKDAEMKSTGVLFPWQGSKEGDISIENIIKVLKSDPAYGEWKQGVTGFKFGFIRHPEYELFSRNSVHWQANASCADCHMPYERVGANKISSHHLMSPLKNDLKACQQCHTESPEWLRQQVYAIQDRTVSLMLRAGYANAVTAKLFETAHKAQAEGKTLDQPLYNQAKDLYIEAFYRMVFVGAENGVGFHNPTEAARILGDSVAMAAKADALLRQALAQAGVQVPVDVDLGLAKYVNKRGVKGLMFQPDQEFKDPFGIQNMLTPPASLGLSAGPAPASKP